MILTIGKSIGKMNHLMRDTSILSTFINTVQDYFLHQHVTKHTRFGLGEEPSLLDLIFTYEEGLIYNLEYQSGLGDSDHISLSFYLVCKNEMERKSELKPNFFRADYRADCTAIKRICAEVEWKRFWLEILRKVRVFLERLTLSLEGNVPKCTKQRRRQCIHEQGSDNQPIINIKLHCIFTCINIKYSIL